MENQAGWPDDQARTTVVSLPGEVSYYNATQVHEELMAALEPGVTTVILDLTLTTFFRQRRSQQDRGRPPAGQRLPH